MTFRSRLWLFFLVIVAIPMVAIGAVLLRDAERDKAALAEARAAAATRTAYLAFDRARARADRTLVDALRDPELERALTEQRLPALRRRMTAIARERPHVVSVAYYDSRGRLRVRVGGDRAIALAALRPRAPSGRSLGTLTVASVSADAYAREVARLTQAEVRIVRGGRLLASTVATSAASDAATLEVGDRRLRGRFTTLSEPVGPPVRFGLFARADARDAVVRDRLAIVGLVGLFLVLALGAAVLVVRALHGQVGELLAAARRLGGGDFEEPVPVQGDDEFAALAVEFNRMSDQLAAKIEEVERGRRESEEALRRVGDAFAAGLDRQSIVDLAVRTAVEACGAEAGRAVPIDATKMLGSNIGMESGRLRAAIEAVEREAFRIRAEDGSELLANLELGERVQPGPRRPTELERDGVHALAVPLRTRLAARGDSHYVGVVSIARHGAAFTEAQLELFAYLAGQAAVSIENAHLHEMVHRQASTDGLTGLHNLRHFREALDREVERNRRYGSSTGLVMLDIDDFKQINDGYGHQQGDLVLIQVARTLSRLVRDVDEAVRYGGEEMALVLTQTDLEGAVATAERLRREIAELAVRRLDGGGRVRVTASFGVAALPACAHDADGLVAAADAALYRAKRAGKNRVERADAGCGGAAQPSRPAADAMSPLGTAL